MGFLLLLKVRAACKRSFPANKAFLDIFISSKNMLFLGSTLCVMSMMVNSMKILIMLMDDWSSRMWVSALCIFFFFCSVFCDSWLGSGSSWLLEVVASSAGEKGGAYGSQDSRQVVSAQRKKKQNKREQRHIAVFVVESANIRLYPLFKYSLLLLFLLSLFLNSCDT